MGVWGPRISTLLLLLSLLPILRAALSQLVIRGDRDYVIFSRKLFGITL
jgi:hypothetical protein